MMCARVKHARKEEAVVAKMYKGSEGRKTGGRCNYQASFDTS